MSPKHLKKSKLPRVNLGIGDVVFVKEPSIISTILGSCVGVSMYAPLHGVSALCHAKLPQGEDFGYVDACIDYMIKEFSNMGISTTNIEVKVFGGSRILNSSIGDANIEATFEILNGYKIKPKVFDVGGDQGRSLLFDTSDGTVYIRKVKKLLNL